MKSSTLLIRCAPRRLDVAVLSSLQKLSRMHRRGARGADQAVDVAVQGASMPISRCMLP